MIAAKCPFINQFFKIVNSDSTNSRFAQNFRSPFFTFSSISGRREILRRIRIRVGDESRIPISARSRSRSRSQSRPLPRSRGHELGVVVLHLGTAAVTAGTASAANAANAASAANARAWLQVLVAHGRPFVKNLHPGPG